MSKHFEYTGWFETFRAEFLENGGSLKSLVNEDSLVRVIASMGEKQQVPPAKAALILSFMDKGICPDENYSAQFRNGFTEAGGGEKWTKHLGFGKALMSYYLRDVPPTEGGRQLAEILAGRGDRTNFGNSES